MPATYTLIASNTLSSSAASVTFSAIPATYTDLVLRLSARGTTSGEQESLGITFNSDTSTNYSRISLVGTGSSALSLSGTGEVNLLGLGNGSTSTSNTFSNSEHYIPSYTVSQKKPISAFLVYENNATSARIHPTASLWQGTAAITSMTITPQSSANIASGSSFFLYGIKNS
jgi:hypothetical protein